MSFHLYLSNSHKELIKEKLIPTLENTPEDPFMDQKIIIQRQGISAFLKNTLIQKQEMICNLDLPFLNKYVHNTFEDSLPEPPDFGFFQPGVMCWHIYSILEDIQNDYADLSQYLQGEEQELKRFQLSQKIANIFDDYQLYRPDLIRKWENDTKIKEDNWQAEIWEELTDGRISITEGFQNFIVRNFDNNLWSREYICVFDIPTMAPIYLSFFKKLSQYIDIHFFHISQFKEDQLPELPNQNNKYQQPFFKNRLDSKYIHNLTGKFENPLLKKFGATNLEFTTILYNIADYCQTNYIQNETDHYLSNLQNSIIEDQNNQDIDIDRSIQIHSTHSPLREVETLYNYLLELLNNDPELSPDNINIIIPEIKKYIPHIRAVFERYDKGENKYLPYNIADEPPAGIDKLKETLLKILNIDQSRFKASILIDILGSKSVRTKFNIDQENLSLIKKWIRESGIRWGIDTDYHKKFGHSDFKENSWEFGLNRMLLGYAMRDQEEKKDRIYKNILPYDKIEGEYAEILGKLHNFFNELKKFYNLFQDSHSLSDWEDIIINILNTFFNQENENQIALIQLRQIIQNLFENIEKEEEENYNLSVIKHYLDSNIIVDAEGRGYFRGKITIGSPQHIFGIPSKITCILGLNEGVFPRDDIDMSFNKLTKFDRLADRSKQKEDKNIFLQSLLSTEKYLFLSYQGFDNKTNEELPPSIVINYTLDFITNPINDNERKENLLNKIITKHRLHSFNPDYFQSQKDKHYSYLGSDYRAAKALQEKSISQVFYDSDLSLPKYEIENSSIQTQELVNFFKHPVKYFSRNRLGIELKREEREINDREPIELDSLEKYLLKENISKALINKKEKNKIYEVLKAEGQLPVKNRSKPIFEKELRFVKNGLDRIYSTQDFRFNPLKLLKKSHYKELNIEQNNFRITGQIGPVAEDRHIYFQPSQFKGKHAIQMWIKHILLNSYTEIETIGILIDEKDQEFKCFYLSPLNNSNTYLEFILEKYTQGMNNPLPFFPNSSYYKHNNPKKKRNKFWNNDYRNDNDYDQYAELFFDKDLIGQQKFMKLSRDIFSPFTNLLNTFE